MISQVYLVKYGSYVGYASTYEEAVELEKQYKCYAENNGAISITADEAREYRDKHKSTVLKSDGCLSAAQAQKETEPKGWSSILGYGKHIEENIDYDDLLINIL